MWKMDWSSDVRRSTRSRILQVLAALSLACTYVAIGFAICAGFPQITRSLAYEQSAHEASPYAPDALLDLAMETRAFTIDDYGRDSDGEGAADARLAAHLLDQAAASEATPDKASAWSDEAKAIIASAEDQGADATEAMFALYELSPSYALDADALSHLDDVHEVITSVRMPIMGCTLIAAFCLMALVLMFGPKPAGHALIASGCIALASFALCGIWALIGFDGLFSALHGLFFADGTWTFPPESLLIQMYPQGFWMGMGLWWLGSSCIVAVASIIIGAIIVRRAAKQAREEPRRPAGLQA